MPKVNPNLSFISFMRLSKVDAWNVNWLNEKILNMLDLFVIYLCM